MLGTRAVVDGLRGQGFDVGLGYVNFLIRERHIPSPGRIGSNLAWSDGDIQRLRSVLTRRGRGPFAGGASR